MNHYNYHRRKTDKLTHSEKMVVFWELVSILGCFSLTYWAMIQGII